MGQGGRSTNRDEAASLRIRRHLLLRTRGQFVESRDNNLNSFFWKRNEQAITPMDTNGMKPPTIPVLVWQTTVGVSEPRWTPFTVTITITF